MQPKVTGLFRGNPGFFWRVTTCLAFLMVPDGAAQLLPTKTTLVSSPNPSVLGQAVTLTATVSPVIAPAPVSKVTFYDGVNVLGIRTLSDGKATLTTALLPSGSHSLRAYYSGDIYFLAASASARITQRVVPLPQSGFLPAQHYKAGTAPTFVAVGDFNGDGKADLAVVNSDKVSVLLGNGAGVFSTPVSYDAGFIPVFVAVGDFNGDGVADLAVANLENVSVLLGKGDGTFLPKVNYDAGIFPASVAVGDFNGDGIEDLAVANLISNDVSVLLGDARGGFQVAINYGVGSSPAFVAIGDFNGDGKADLAVVNSDSADVSVLLGFGDGTFKRVAAYVVGAFPGSVAVADFNGDGKEDLAVTGGGVVNLLPGNGDGTFLAPISYNAGADPVGVAVGDFNGDGKVDLAVTNSSGDNVSVLLGDGRGNFQAAVNYGVGTLPGFLLVADFNGDGKADLAVANAKSDNVSILLGLGVPISDLTITKTHVESFNQGQTGASYSITVSNLGPVPTKTGTVTVTDTLPAGLTATAITGAGWSCTLQPLRCTRSDALEAFGKYPALTLTVNVASDAPASVTNTATVSSAGDLNFANNTASDPTSILHPKTTLALAHSPNPSVLGQTVTLTATVSPAAATGTVTFYDGVVILGSRTLSEGKATLATALLPSGSRSLRAYYGGDSAFAASASEAVAHTVVALPQNGFRPAVSYNAGPLPFSIAVGDFNSDGRADLAVASGSVVSVLLGNGDGTFQAAADYKMGIALAVALGDFNGDGKSDLAVASGGVVSVLLGNGDGTFGPAVNYKAGSDPQSLAVADFNGDGKADLAVANLENVSVLLGKGDGTFQPAINYSAGSASQSIAIGDFNGDGKADLAVADALSNNVSVLLGNGDGTFRPQITYKTGNNPRAVAVGDFNGDRRLDLAVANSGSNNVSVLLGNGNGTFQPPVNYNAGSAPQSVAVGDFNGDGKADLAVANAFSNNVSVLLGNADGTFQAAVNYSAGSAPQSIAVGDFNRDGVSDLAVANAINTVSILLGVPVPIPDLTVKKTHAGSFARGQTRAAFTITVSNNGAGATTGTVTVTDTLPAGLTAAAMSGAGWSCALATLACARSDALEAGGSYPPITLTVNVASSAEASITNTATVSGGGELNTANNAASDPITTVQTADLTVTKTHAGDFLQGQAGAAYTITVSNRGAGPTTGTVTVTDTLPAGLTAAAMSGAGWTCALATPTCTRSDVLEAGASYPPLTLTVNVANTAEASLTNTATVSGGGELNTANNTASDPTTISPSPDLTITKTHAGNFLQGQAGAAYTITVSNKGSAPTTGTVTVTDTLPAGLTAAAMSGAGWTCALATPACTRSDALETGASYPPITLTVNVASSAAASLANTATVSGGGEFNLANNTALDPTTVLQTPVVNAGGIVNGASFSTDGLVSPGSLASLFGLNLAADTALAGEVPLPRALAGAQVLVNDTAAPLFYVSPTQINFQMPAEETGTEASIVVASSGGRSLSATAKIVPQAPGIFSAQPGGTGQGAVLNQDFSPNSAQNPAPRGSVIQIFATGLGGTNPPLASGQPGAQAEPFNRIFVIPAVSVGGVPAGVFFAAVAPGFVGLYQINARIPPSAPSGTAVSLQIVAGGRSSNTVTIAVQ